VKVAYPLFPHRYAQWRRRDRLRNKPDIHSEQGRLLASRLAMRLCFWSDKGTPMFPTSTRLSGESRTLEILQDAVIGLETGFPCGFSAERGTSQPGPRLWRRQAGVTTLLVIRIDCSSFCRFSCLLSTLSSFNYFLSTISLTLRCSAIFSWASSSRYRHCASTVIAT
jgi:hypothetical protein